MPKARGRCLISDDIRDTPSPSNIVFSSPAYSQLHAATESADAAGSAKHRLLGKTGLKVSEIGFGGQSWSRKTLADGKGGVRTVSVDEAERMIGAAMDMGVNFFDHGSPHSESTTPGEALKRLKRRDKAIICCRVMHNQRGVEADKENIYKWVDGRLKLYQVEHFDLVIVSNSAHDTPRSGYWDMEYSIEALARVKKQGKARFTGFGSHFTPDLFLQAIEKYGKDFDVISLPYNVRHRAAEEILRVAKKAGLGTVMIKPFAGGSLFKLAAKRGEDTAGFARTMITFVLENADVDVTSPGVHTETQMRQAVSASWTTLSPEERKRLGDLAAQTPCWEYPWLEKGWLYA